MKSEARYYRNRKFLTNPQRTKQSREQFVKFTGWEKENMIDRIVIKMMYLEALVYGACAMKQVSDDAYERESKIKTKQVYYEECSLKRGIFFRLVFKSL